MIFRRHQHRSVRSATALFLSRDRALTLILFCLFSCAFASAQSDPQPTAAVASQRENTNLDAPGPMDPLSLARKSVEHFFESSANVVSTESITQTILGKNAKAVYREEAQFNYQLQASAASGSLKLVESRDPRKASFRDPSRTLLITNGFASMLLIVHPTYETSYKFEPAGDELIGANRFAKVQFKAIPGTPSPAALQLRGQNYPIPLSGTLWIDPQTGAVIKLVAMTDSSLSDLGLQGMRSEIHYANVQFHDPDETYWMPTSAVIDVETPRQHWRNVHRFSEYRRFRATIEVEFRDKP